MSVVGPDYPLMAQSWEFGRFHSGLNILDILLGISRVPADLRSYTREHRLYDTAPNPGNIDQDLGLLLRAIGLYLDNSPFVNAFSQRA